MNATASVIDKDSAGPCGEDAHLLTTDYSLGSEKPAHRLASGNCNHFGFRPHPYLGQTNMWLRGGKHNGFGNGPSQGARYRVAEEGR